VQGHPADLTACELIAKGSASRSTFNPRASANCGLKPGPTPPNRTALHSLMEAKPIAPECLTAKRVEAEDSSSLENHVVRILNPHRRGESLRRALSIG
jgi:hypothetical protein